MRQFIALLIACSLFVFITSRAPAQEKKDEKAGMGQPSKEDMDKMMKVGMPGPEHQEMMKSAGDWDAECHFMMNGQASPPMKGTMHIEPMFDGRYMLMHYEGVMNMGQGDMP